MPRSSKRKRASRVPRTGITDEEIDAVSAPSDDGEPELDAEGHQHQKENGDANRRYEVEAEIWDSFREEFHEGTFTHPVSLLDERHAAESKQRWNSSLCTCTGRTRYCANWMNRSQVTRAVARPELGSCGH
jgi:hypothetical protein